jgi:hypothetical protein
MLMLALFAENAASQTNTFPSSGAVGIGTTSPSQLLDIQGSSSPTIAITNTGMSGSPYLVIGMNSGNNAALFQTTSGKDFKFYNGQYALTILGSNGNVGLGTNAPSSRLHVVDATPPQLILENTSGNVRMDLWRPSSSNNAQVAFKTNGSFDYQIGEFADSNLQIRSVTSPNNGLTLVGSNGNVGIGTTNPTTKLEIAGDVTVSGNISAKYQDLAEWVSATQILPAGTVVVLDTETDNAIIPSSVSYDTHVAGVVSDSPGIVLGVGGPGKLKIATTGRVKVHVDTSNGPIQRGDLLVTSTREGVAMRSEPIDVGGAKFHRPGTLIGKALEPLESGEGEILVLLSLQ